MRPIRPIRIRGENICGYGVEDLTSQELAQRKMDDTLMMRMLVLMVVAHTAN